MTFEVHILLFGSARELAGNDRIKINVKPQTTTAEIVHEISEKYPILKEIAPHCVLAVGERYRHHHERLFLESSTEIALIPPISGG
ncbi:hypothetical protein FO519_002769 [Halicephalobus sp. NKZ332]|nr:hypothetical protein FO519_002769 [Halicephalobus sp. NKZ332]